MEKAPENGHNIVKEIIIKKRVDQTRVDELIDIFVDLVQTIWDRIFPTLGRVTIMAIMERALAQTKEHFSIISHLSIESKGVSFKIFREKIATEDRCFIQESLMEFVANLIDILAILTGNILVTKLQREFEGRAKHE